jgi:hypothetical protein
MRAMTASARAFVISDAVALLVFVAIGTANHGNDLTFLEVGATAAPLLVAWFAMSLATRLYREDTDGWRRLALTWVVAVPVAVLLRSVLRGGPWDERLPVFAAVALAFTALFVLAGRAAVLAWRRARRQEPSPS